MYVRTVIFLDDLVKLDYPQKVPKLQYASWIGDTNSIVFVDNNDIYYIHDLANESKIVRLTTTGESNTITNGMPDSLYRLNIYTKPNDAAIWWSSDANYLAYITFDDSQVEPSPIEYYDSYIADTNVNPKIYYERYPRAGAKNPRVAINVVRLNFPNNIEPIEVTPPNEIMANQQDGRLLHYITYVEWLPTNELLVMWSSRAQNSSLLSLCGNKQSGGSSSGSGFWNSRPTSSGEQWTCEMLTIFNQKIPIMKDSKQTIITGYNQNQTRLTFLALPRPDSDIGDHYHIAMVRAGERYVKFLTYGEYDVDRLVLYDSMSDSLYYEAKSTRQPERHLYRITQASLLQARRAECLTCNLREPCGYSNSHVSPSGAQYMVHECLGPSVPVIRLRFLANLTNAFVLGTNAHIEQILQAKQLPQEKLIVLKMDNQLPYDVHMKMYLPTEIEEEKDKRFPLLIESSDLEHRNVWSKFEIDWGKYLASRKQLVYIKIDCIRARNLASSSSLGSTDNDARFISTSPVFNSKDQVDVIRYLIDAVDDFPFIDRKRIAIWGPTSTSSYVALATTADDDTKSIQCTIAVAPITNFKYLDTYTAEHFLGLPWIDSNNLKYEKANLLKRGYDFATRKVLIIHGTADERVHVQHSMQFIKALTEHHVVGGVIHQTQLYPDSDHSLSDVRLHLFRTMDGFLDRCFYQKPITIKATEWKGKVRPKL